MNQNICHPSKLVSVCNTTARSKLTDSIFSVLPYEPPFEMPDYSHIGGALMDLAHSYLPDELISRPQNNLETSDNYFSPEVMHLRMPDVGKKYSTINEDTRSI